MKLALLLVVILGCGSSAPAPATPAAGTLEMKAYTLVLLRRGPTWSPDETPESKQIFAGHMANIEAMAKTGRLVLAGPIDADATDKAALAGIFVFDADAHAVEAMLANDPAIAGHRLVPELLPWYGPAGITFPGKGTIPK